MIASPGDLADAAALADGIGARFIDTVIVLDAPVGSNATRARPALDARVLAHPLDGDFGAQRCRAQDACRAPWVLQLDADERPEPALLDAMDALAAMADRQGLRSLGFRRRNLVDGVWSDLWPDIQYRLNRRELRFRGRVHERPDAGGWRRSAIVPLGAIEHRLDGKRVRERTRRYGAMEATGARETDETALLRPFRP